MKVQTHQWKGVDAQSNPLEGEMPAPSLAVVQHQLAQQGIRLTHCVVKPKKRLSQTINSQQFETCVAQLASLMQSGIPLASSLGFVSQGFSEAGPINFMKRLQSHIESGLELHVAMSKEPGIDRAHIQLIKAGELSGNLDGVLMRLSEHLETRRSLLRNIRSALNYPLIVGGVAVIVVGLVLTQVVPIFEEVFSQMGANLPLPTQLLIGMSRHLIQSGPHWAIATALFVISMNLAWKQFALLRSFLLRVALVIPMLGPLWLLTCQQRFTATLAVLLESGLPLPDSLEMAGEAANHPVFRRAGQDIRRRVEQGQSLAESMSHARAQILIQRIVLFPPLLVHLVKLGEGSGQLDEMVSRWSRDAQKRLTTRLLGLTDWLEPGLMMFMGVVVGGLVMALYLPMFQMGQHF